MKLILTVIVLAFSLAQAQEEALLQDAITRPTQSIRCKELFKERAEKIKMQQKLNALLQRNQDLIKKTETNKETLIAKLRSTEVKIKSEQLSTTQQISQMEENIVRSGCPGLSL